MKLYISCHIKWKRESFLRSKQNISTLIINRTLKPRQAQALRLPSHLIVCNSVFTSFACVCLWACNISRWCGAGRRVLFVQKQFSYFIIKRASDDDENSCKCVGKGKTKLHENELWVFNAIPHLINCYIRVKKIQFLCRYYDSIWSIKCIMNEWSKMRRRNCNTSS